MRRRFRKTVEYSTDHEALLVLIYLLPIQVAQICLNNIKSTLTWMHEREKLVFPALAFVSNYVAMDSLFPPHPIRQVALISISVMSATLTITFMRLIHRRPRFHFV